MLNVKCQMSPGDNNESVTPLFMFTWQIGENSSCVRSELSPGLLLGSKHGKNPEGKPSHFSESITYSRVIILRLEILMAMLFRINYVF